eukprot:GHRR01016877.1.p2 GENE.GHRR01016877.1~~GHRR01016877.1.p2  ORF type:complete len:125 (-),score=12.15 GHRR01016877.1:364-738(-)
MDANCTLQAKLKVSRDATQSYSYQPECTTCHSVLQQTSHNCQHNTAETEYQQPVSSRLQCLYKLILTTNICKRLGVKGAMPTHRVICTWQELSLLWLSLSTPHLTILASRPTHLLQMVAPATAK